MNIDNIFLPREIVIQILQHASPSCMNICKTFQKLFYVSFLESCEHKPLLHDRLYCLPTNFSDQEKVKRLYQNIFFDFKVLNLSEDFIFNYSSSKLEHLDRYLENMSLFNLFYEKILKQFENEKKDFPGNNYLLEKVTPLSKKIALLSAERFNQSNHVSAISDVTQVIREWMHAFPEAISTYSLIIHHEFMWGILPKLPKLPKEIGLFKDLKVINLEGVTLTHLPRELGQLIRLKKFFLRCNKFNGLPPEIKNLTQLKKLVLTSDQQANPFFYADYFENLGTKISSDSDTDDD